MSVVKKKAEDIQLDTERGPIAGKLWGSAKGLPVLALHGWLDNAASFDPLIPLLPDSLRICALDLPGHGFSYHRGPGLPYHFIDWVGDVESVLDALGWKQAALVGHSLGGGIAAVFAGTLPKRATRLALLDSLGPLTNEPEGMPDRLAQHLAQRRRLAGKEAPVYATLDAVVALRRRATELSEESARRLVERGMESTRGGVRWRSDPKLRLPSPMRLTGAQVDAFLKRITCPQLAIVADRGLFAGEGPWKERMASLQHLRVIKVEGHHHVHMDHPDRVATALGEFLEEE